MKLGIWRTPPRTKMDRRTDQAVAARCPRDFPPASTWLCLLLGAVAISWNSGCHALLPTRSILMGQFGTSESEESPAILVDRTGQPLPGEGPAPSANSVPRQIQPTTTGQPTSSHLRPTTPDFAGSATTPPSSPSSPSEEQRAVDQLIGQRTPARLPSGTNQSVPPQRREPNSGLNSIPFEDIALTGPNDASPTRSATTASFATQNQSNASMRPQSQSFPVKVIDERTSERPIEEISPSELAASQSMVQAIQQVTSRGLGRIAGGPSDDSASPALANLLMDQVQQSISHGQIQQASAALQGLESNGEIPAFDLRGNRPLNTTNSSAANLETTNDFPETASTMQSQPITSGSSPNEGSATVIAWRPAIKQAIDSVEQTISQTNDSQEKQSLEIYLRLLRLIAHDPDQAVRSIESLPKPRQAFWREQIFALSQIIQAPEAEQDAMFVNHSRQATKALAHLQNAIDSLKSEATLQLRQVQFCQEIRSFGDYDLARTTLMAPGEPMLIYCEVLNYLATQSSDIGGGYYHTNLVPSYMIFDAQQQVVSQKEFAVVRDRCRSRRQDFYLVLQLEVPNLPSGKYHLQVSVEDQEANKIAVSAPIPFQVRN